MEFCAGLCGVCIMVVNGNSCVLIMDFWPSVYILCKFIIVFGVNCKHSFVKIVNFKSIVRVKCHLSYVSHDQC